MSILSHSSSLSQHAHPDARRLSGHALDCALMEAQHAAREIEAAEADADAAMQSRQRFASSTDDDDRTPPPPTAGALSAAVLAEIACLPDFALIAAIEAADRHDPALRVDDYDAYLDAASTELVRRLNAEAETRAIHHAITTCGYGSREHCEVLVKTFSTPELIAKCKAPEPSHFSVHAAAVYCAEMLRRAELLRIEREAIDKPAAKRRRWKKTTRDCADGTRLIKRLPSDGVPALARVGMVVYDGDSNESVIESVHPDHCVARNLDGALVVLAWHEVMICHVAPDPAAIGRTAA